MRVLVKKEFRDFILSYRLFLGTWILLAVFSLSAVVWGNRYLQDVENLSIAKANYENYLQQHGSVRGLWMFKMKSTPPLSPIFIGYQDHSPFFGESWFGDYDESLAFFPTLDIGFIAALAISLLALLFTFDSITRERENGSLKSVCSNSISRTKILLAKVIGSSGGLSLAVIPAWILAFLILSIGFRIDFTGDDLIAYLLIVIMSCLYLLLFTTIGVTVSAFARTSTSALLTALVIWIAGISVIPGLGPALADLIKPVERWEQHLDEIRKIGGPEGYEKTLKKRYEDRQEGESWAPLYYQTREEFDYYGWWRRLDDEYFNRVERTARLTQQLASISPYAAFLLCGQALADTGLIAHYQYARKNLDNEIDIWEYQGRTVLNNPGKDVDSPGSVDLSDVPRFHLPPRALRERLAEALPSMAWLTGETIFFLLIGLALFWRYDVR
ncbi:ABC transporter permease subunit [candidate division KSB1 bacterium]